VPTPTVPGAIPLRDRRSLADEWAEFSRLIVPRNAPEVQRVEMRRAWYAGAAAMFGLMTGGLDADHEPTDLDVAYVESLSEEIETFSRDLARGKA
jgi:hypothetical protein